MIHLDLFSGIGGFAYAVDQVWDGATHVFCDNDKFCQQVIKKHWPESEIIDDIKNITDTSFQRTQVEASQASTQGRDTSLQRKREMVRQRDRKVDAKGARASSRPFILTGGFPCQPFSAAGVRRGTADERYLWPEMFRVIRLTKPEWVIAENVRGLLTWKDGLVFEQVCTDLEGEGYEVQPFIIPAIAVNAPHRRDRIWWVARNTEYTRPDATQDTKSTQERKRRNPQGSQEPEQSTRPDNLRTEPTKSWERDWLEVATELCSVDDGLPVELGEFKLSKSKHREEQIKAYGNAIVPQVAIEIMRGIARSSTL